MAARLKIGRVQCSRLTTASLAVLAAAIAPTGAGAQTVVPPGATRVVPDGAAPLTTETVVTTSNGVNWFVTGGRYAGPADNPYQNLFHSFRYFDVKAGDSVVWVGDGNRTSVRNVINRVTGGEPSLLFGALNAELYPNANFFFINPAGIVFGSNFQVNVPQGLYFSTANSLRFSDGLSFMARTPDGSSFSVAAPTSFGFVGNSGDMLFADRSGPTAASVATGRGAPAQFSAPNISLTGSNLSIGNADMRLVAVGSGTLNLPTDRDAALPGLSGRLLLSGATINLSGSPFAPVSGQRPGGFAMYGGTVSILAGTDVFSVASVSGHGGDIRIVGSSVIVDNSTLSNATTTSRDSGAIIISGGTVTLNRAEITTSTNHAGNAGSIRIETTQGLLSDTHSKITSVASDFIGDESIISPIVTGATGDIRLSSTGDINLTGSTIGTQAEDYGARAGGIDIAAAGNITIRADPGMPGSGVSIFAVSNSRGTYLPPASGAPAGGIRISGGRIDMTGVGERTVRGRVDYPDRVNITSTTTGEHPAGDVTITARDGLNLTRADILATTVGPGTATGSGGALRFTAANIIADNTLLESSSLSGGNAGGAVLSVSDTLRFSNFTVLSSASTGGGAAGNIHISLGRAGIIETGSRIDSDVNTNGSLAGNIVISGVNASLDISSTGPGTPELRVTSVSSSTANSANGGSIRIDVASLRVSGGAGIVSDAHETATGTGGSINVNAQTIRVEGTGSAIAARALAGSDAGAINLTANQISILDGGAVSTSAKDGTAGRITLLLPDTGLLQLAGSAQPGSIVTNSNSKSGGEIRISNPLAIISNGGEILALGEIRSARADIISQYFIRSTDRRNVLSVDGSLVVDSQIDDVSRGTNRVESEFVDARQVLSGRCASSEVSGRVSQLSVSASGPFAFTELTGDQAVPAAGSRPGTSNCGR